ncbi:MAG: hypothetical protein DHS20C05_24240 [Hyphococcus sp.]|nr:MAG: hypothetical protein DHS20C05_24240 [Marinicaulis sp.]
MTLPHLRLQSALLGAAMAAFLVLTACSQNSQTLTQAEREEIKSAVTQSFDGLVDAVLALDHDKYFSYFDTEKYTSLNEDGTVTHTFDAFKTTYLAQTAYLKEYKSLSFDNVKITVIDRANAVLVNEYEAEIVLTSGDAITAKGGGTQVWSKSTGAWKLVSVSSSAKPAE